MDLDQLTDLSPASLRALLPGWLCGYIEAPTALRERVYGAVHGALSALDDAQLTAGLAAYGALGDGYTVHPAHPLARSVSRAFMRPILEGSAVSGLEQLAAIAGQPQVWIGNHLSYIDTQVTDSLLAEAGLGAVADGVMTVAGPKVYSDPFRRFAALGVTTLKAPQSSSLATNQSGLSPREIARLAIDCVALSEAWRSERGPVLLYPEGTRSRSGRVGPFLRAAARYARAPRDGAPLWIVPVCVTGTERLFPMDEHMYPRAVRLSVGAPFAAAGREKLAVLEEARRGLIALLPPDYQPSAAPPTLS